MSAWLPLSAMQKSSATVPTLKCLHYIWNQESHPRASSSPRVSIVPGLTISWFPQWTAYASGTACGKPADISWSSITRTCFLLALGWPWVILSCFLSADHSVSFHIMSKQNLYKSSFIRLIDMVGRRTGKVSGRVLLWLHSQDFFLVAWTRAYMPEVAYLSPIKLHSSIK